LIAAPDAPSSLAVDNVTNSSALLTWVKPENENGVLQSFRLYKTPYDQNPLVIDVLVMSIHHLKLIGVRFKFVDFTSIESLGRS